MLAVLLLAAAGLLAQSTTTGAVFGTVTDPALLVAVQALDGITGATLGVLTALVAADITNGTGRFNLLQGVIGTLSGIGATLSTSLSGFAVQKFGHTAGFLGVAAVALAAVVILFALMPETTFICLPSRGELAAPPYRCEDTGEFPSPQRVGGSFRSRGSPSRRGASNRRRSSPRRPKRYRGPPCWRW